VTVSTLKPMAGGEGTESETRRVTQKAQTYRHACSAEKAEININKGALKMSGRGSVLAEI